MLPMFQDTIAAIATPLAEGAISIIRLSGEDAIPIAESIFSRPLAGRQSHSITHGTIVEDGQPVDEVLVSLFRAPKTYTREDVVEINAHGGIHVTRRILSLLLSHGARLANPGEFTQRAFLNGRIDLAQAEAVNDMIKASSDQAASMAIYGIQGSVRKLLEPLIEDLTDIIAAIEVNIDYPEYDDVEEMTAHQLLPQTDALLARMDEILKASRRGQILKSGINTVIAGKPNVGKSSLLNALLEEDKAIVTEIAGTTRDVVEGQIHLGSLQLNLIDTAGIHDSADRIEQIGIEKSRQMIDQAYLVLLVLDHSRPLDDEDRELLKATENRQRIVILNKSDLPAAFTLDDVPTLSLSAKNQEIAPLQDLLEDMMDAGELSARSILTSERQIGLLETARRQLKSARESMAQGMEPDLFVIDLTDARTHLKEILGEVPRDDLLDTLFSKFCLGK